MDWTWDLGKLYKEGFDDPQFAADMEQAARMVAEDRAAVATYSHEGDEVAQLEDAIRRLSDLDALTTRLGHMVFLTLAVDANNEAAQAAQNRIMLLGVEAQQLTSALTVYVGQMADLDGVIAASELLRVHEYVLHGMKKDAAHVIDPAVEPAVLQMQLTGGSAWSQLRDQLDANHLIDFEVDGEMKKLPLSAIRGMADSPDADVRRRAYEAEIAAYPRIEIPMAACLNGIKGEALTLAKMRHFDSVLDTALDVSHMDRQTLDAMITAMKESLPIWRRYYRLKARLLGYEGGMKWYDAVAPVGKSDTTYTVEQARQLLVTEMGKFSEKMGKFIDHAFEDRWIDMFPHEGKQGGAFCSGVHPLGTSYVMTNFNGSMNSVSTLAHELGHAYHNDCVKDLPILLADYPMPLAETASIFNETLLSQKLLANAQGEEKLMLLESQLAGDAQVIVDILSRYLFESEVVERRKDHALSPRELCEIMLDAQRQTYGDGLDPDCMHPYMWACKSHYYGTDVHFYNFPYAFGLLFGKGVFAQYQAEGEAFLPKYDKLLAYTGQNDVREVAASVGIDVTDVNFWRSSLKVEEEAICELEKLAEELHK